MLTVSVVPSVWAVRRSSNYARGFIPARRSAVLAPLRCGGLVDLLLVDGFSKVAKPIIELMAPQLRKGAIVMCDDVGHFPRSFVDYLDFVRLVVRWINAKRRRLR